MPEGGGPMPDDEWWMEDANIAGANRIDRMASLKASYESQGIAVRQDFVPGVTHDPPKVIGPVKQFFADTLRQHRATREKKRAAG